MPARETAAQDAAGRDGAHRLVARCTLLVAMNAQHENDSSTEWEYESLVSSDGDNADDEDTAGDNAADEYSNFTTEGIVSLYIEQTAFLLNTERMDEFKEHIGVDIRIMQQYKASVSANDFIHKDSVWSFVCTMFYSALPDLSQYVRYCHQMQMWWLYSLRKTSGLSYVWSCLCTILDRILQRRCSLLLRVDVQGAMTALQNIERVLHMMHRHEMISNTVAKFQVSHRKGSLSGHITPRKELDNDSAFGDDDLSEDENMQ